METGVFPSQRGKAPGAKSEERNRERNKAREGHGSFLREAILELNLES